MHSLTSLLATPQSVPLKQAWNKLFKALSCSDQKMAWYTTKHYSKAQDLTAVSYPRVRDYADVGTANDYLLRIRLCLQQGVPFDFDRTVAMAGLRYARKHTGRHHSELEDVLVASDLIYTQLAKVYREKQRGVRAEEFMALRQCALQLSHLDGIYRNHRKEDGTLLAGLTTQQHRYELDLLADSTAKVTDLELLWKNTDTTWFTPKQQGFTNLTLGGIEDILVASDCDLIVDNCLVDVKTTKGKDVLDGFLQCFCYWLLYSAKFAGRTIPSRVGGAPAIPNMLVPSNDRCGPVSKLALFYPRFGDLAELNLGYLVQPACVNYEQLLLLTYQVVQAFYALCEVQLTEEGFAALMAEVLECEVH